LLNSFIEGFLLGVGAAVPIGAINILIMNTALKNYKSAVFIGFGAMSADISYLLLILLGMMTFFNNPYMADILGVLGAGFLIYMAYLIYKSRNNTVDNTPQKVSKKNLLKFYTQGYILTFINPYTIAFWLSVAGYVANKNINPTTTIFGMFCAILLWITLMPYFVHRSKHKISKKVSFYINIGSTIILTGFAISLLYSIF